MWRGLVVVRSSNHRKTAAHSQSVIASTAVISSPAVVACCERNLETAVVGTVGEDRPGEMELKAIAESVTVYDVKPLC
jgi:hypothetical protein